MLSGRFMVSKPSIHKVVVPGLPSRLEQVCDTILSQARANKYTEDEVFAMHLAIEEAFANALRHGNRNDMKKTITVEYSVSPKRIDIFVTDQGSGFMPDDVPDPRCDENIYKTFGRGVLLMRSYMDKVEYNNPGNSVHMVKFKEKNNR